MKKAAELVFIPAPGMGHLVSTVEIAKRLVDRDDRLFITVLIMKHSLDSKVDAYAESLKASSLTDQRIQFVDLPQADTNQETKANPKGLLVAHIIESSKPHVRQIVNSKSNSNSKSGPQLAGLVVDMFCTTMVDVANEFGVPTYVFFTSSAGFLGFMLDLPILRDEHNLDTTELKDSDTELLLQSFVNPVPARVLPNVSLNKESVTVFLEFARRLREAKGIMVNTFMELESYAIHYFNSDAAAAARIPPVYPVGPILNIKGDDGSQGQGHQKSSDEVNIMEWLGDQPQSSVVFLCFGSRGSFGEAQVIEIARGLEQSGTRFLWSLRQPPPKGKIAFPKDHENLKEVLPEGFLDRTAGIGKVIGWAPQVEILAHPAVGGFVSHCGWNSTLESLWFGVPIATWPLYAEQQFNAFELVKELKLAVEIKLDYRRDVMFENENQDLVTAEEIERGIRQVMEGDSETRKKVEEMSKKSRKALKDGGSSHSSLGRFIEDVIKCSSESVSESESESESSIHDQKNSD